MRTALLEHKDNPGTLITLSENKVNFNILKRRVRGNYYFKRSTAGGWANIDERNDLASHGLEVEDLSTLNLIQCRITDSFTRSVVRLLIQNFTKA